MRKKLLTYLFLLFIVQSAIAQDIHFSNFYSNTLNLNPAESGFFTGRHRFCLAYRDQYRTVAQPYKTLAASYDRRISKRTMNSMFGVGILLDTDIAGDANYTTVQFGIPLAHHIPLAGKTILISYGIMPAIHHSAIDYSNLTFGEQFNGIQFIPDYEISEDVDMNSVLYFNIDAGTQITYKPSKTQTYTIGVAWNNINKPTMSFFKDDDAQLRQRVLLHTSAILSITSTFDLVPGAKIQFQGKQHEFQFGGMGICYFPKSTISQGQAGIWFRSKNKDAIIFGLGAQYNGFDIMLNYDLNISTLHTASNFHGAFEITLSYIVEEQNRSKRMTAVRCPHTL